MSEPIKSKGWIGDISWAKQPCSSICNFSGRQFSLLFHTKKDAVKAGWKNPNRIEITIKLVK